MEWSLIKPIDLECNATLTQTAHSKWIFNKVRVQWGETAWGKMFMPMQNTPVFEVQDKNKKNYA